MILATPKGRSSYIISCLGEGTSSSGCLEPTGSKLPPMAYPKIVNHMMQALCR